MHDDAMDAVKDCAPAVRFGSKPLVLGCLPANPCRSASLSGSDLTTAASAANLLVPCEAIPDRSETGSVEEREGSVGVEEADAMSRRRQWCRYCKGYRDHKEKFCPIRTTEPVMDKMLSRFEHLRPFEGYEYDEPGQLLLGGQFRIYVVCMSSGINWPYRKLNADFTTFYEGPGRVDLPDPETDNGMYDAYRFHDYTCGHVCNRIFANARDIGGLNAIAERNKQLLRALIRHISTFVHGRPRGTVPQEAFRVLDCCRQGRHRAALCAFLRFCWLESHDLAVQLRHCSLFLDIRGPCGCGTPDGYCRVKGGNERENKRWVQTHSEWRFRIAREYVTLMNDWCADELEELRNVISQHGPRPVQQDVIHPPQQLLPLEDPREYPTVAETVGPKAVVKKAPQAPAC